MQRINHTLELLKNVDNDGRSPVQANPSTYFMAAYYLSAGIPLVSPDVRAPQNATAALLAADQAGPSVVATPAVAAQPASVVAPATPETRRTQYNLRSGRGLFPIDGRVTKKPSTKKTESIESKYNLRTRKK